VTDILEITNPDSIVIDPDEMELVEIGYVSGGYTPVPGPKGDTGPKGDKGDPGEIAELEIQFASASLTWTANHGLGRHPLVICVAPDGSEVIGDVSWPNATTVLVNWAVPLAGTMRLY
jgi:hypothetical protein